MLNFFSTVWSGCYRQRVVAAVVIRLLATPPSARYANHLPAVQTVDLCRVWHAWLFVWTICSAFSVPLVLV